MAKDQNSEAAKKVADAEKASKKKTEKKGDKSNIFARMGKRIAQFFKDLKGENKKIIWPTGKTIWKSTLVVIICVLIIGIGVWVVDFGLSKGLDAVLGIDIHATEEASTEAATAAPTTAAATTAATTVAATTAAAETATTAAQ